MNHRAGLEERRSCEHMHDIQAPNGFDITSAPLDITQSMMTRAIHWPVENPEAKIYKGGLRDIMLCRRQWSRQQNDCGCCAITTFLTTGGYIWQTVRIWKLLRPTLNVRLTGTYCGGITVDIDKNDGQKRWVSGPSTWKEIEMVWASAGGVYLTREYRGTIAESRLKLAHCVSRFRDIEEKSAINTYGMPSGSLHFHWQLTQIRQIPKISGPWHESCRIPYIFSSVFDEAHHPVDTKNRSGIKG